MALRSSEQTASVRSCDAQRKARGMRGGEGEEEEASSSHSAPSAGEKGVCVLMV